MGSGERGNCHTHGRTAVKITNEKNPHLAARMVNIANCWVVVAIILFFSGIIQVAVGAAIDSDSTYDYKLVEFFYVIFLPVLFTLFHLLVERFNGKFHTHYKKIFFFIIFS